jgi:Raf kinase inhibitor-like YbhB/YbcL family protein
MNVTSVFSNGGNIQAEYTCDGQDKIPPLQISDVPAGAKSLALIVDDPDAPMGTWDHWILWNIPPSTKVIDKQMGVGGNNSWERIEYGGPCPPSGVHRYYFKLYALNIMLDLPEGSNKTELEKTMKGHILAQAALMGKYQRQK